MSAIRRLLVTSFAFAIVATPGAAVLGLVPAASAADGVVVASGPGCCK